MKAARRADPEEMTHQQPEVPSRGREEVALLHVLDPPKPGSPLLAAAAHVSEVAFHSFRAKPLESANLVIVKLNRILIVRPSSRST